MIGGYAWVPLAADRPSEHDYPATAVGAFTSYSLGGGQPGRLAADAVFLSLTGRAPVGWSEDCPEPIAGGYLTPDAADFLALTLIDFAARTRGSKPAQYLTRRDSVVIDGEEHDVVRLVIDKADGISLYTKQGGRRKPVARFYVGELVKLAEG